MLNYYSSWLSANPITPMRFVQGLLFIGVMSGLMASVPCAFGQDEAVRFAQVENETGPSHNFSQIRTMVLVR